jgi:hypothetical protein
MEVMEVREAMEVMSDEVAAACIAFITCITFITAPRPMAGSS